MSILSRPSPLETAKTFYAAREASPVTWAIREGLTDYDYALNFMERRAEAIHRGDAEMVWLVEHPPVLTAGASARREDLLEARFPVHETRRGGQYTYHGPGQRVVYVLLDLNRRRRDVRAFVCALEEWIILSLKEFNICGERRPNRVGVWVRRPEKFPGDNGEIAEDKIAAIGVRLKHWVSFHGLAINVEPDLAHFNVINPCGVKNPHWGVTSMADLGLTATMADLDLALKRNFEVVFGSTQPAAD